MRGHHSASVWEDGPVPLYRGQCAQCGWIHRRSHVTREAAMKAAERHVKTATAADAEVQRILYGPKPH